MGDPRCKWVRDRLSLLTGDELFGLERRRVERHLIGCPKCRAHQVALSHALAVLHAAAGEAPARPDAPSLWPSLARQIQEAHRPASAPAFRFAFAWPRLVLAAGLLGALGTTVVTLAWRQSAEAETRIAVAGRPLAPLAVPVPVRSAPIELPAPPPSTEQVARVEPAAEPAPAPRYDYMLEHGTPMAPDAADAKSSARPSY